MTAKIVLNKKKANDDFGILSVQSFNNGKKNKKSIDLNLNEPLAIIMGSEYKKIINNSLFKLVRFS